MYKQLIFRKQNLKVKYLGVKLMKVVKKKKKVVQDFNRKL